VRRVAPSSPSSSRLAVALAAAIALGMVALATPAAADPPQPQAVAPAAPSARKVEPRAAPAPDPAVPAATPRRALAGFLRAAEERDFARAATFLDLRAVPPARRAREGEELAAMLHRVLVWSVVLSPDSLVDETEPEGLSAVVVETLDLGGQPVPITLERVRGRGTSFSWKFSQRTVAQIRPLYDAQDRRAVEERMPEALTRHVFLSLAAWQWLGLPVALAMSWLVARLTGALLLSLARRLLARARPAWMRDAVDGVSTPFRLGIGMAFLSAVFPYLLLPPGAALIVDRVTVVVWALAVGWTMLALVRTATRAVAAGLPGDTAGELEHRGFRTRLVMIERIAGVGIAIVAVSVVLLQFEVVRTVGLSLLASAGIAGIILGIAAQRTLGGIISGVELAFSQPLRLGDTVVIDKEWGVVEEMFFTYVILRCWDDRRLVVPVTRILSQPFENWTRRSPEMLVQVELHADYRLPVEAVRAELQRLCAAHPLWDQRVARLQVTDATDKTIKLRAVASVDNGAKGFDLRCDLREQLVAFLQRLDDGVYLPRQRVDGEGSARSAPTA
jgi:small-conductance mechanosensitive channel